MQEAPLMLKNKTARRIKDIPGFVFPGGVRVIINFTVDFDAMIFRKFLREPKLWCAQGEFGGRTGLWRLLDVFGEFDVRTTLFLPGQTGLLYPEVLRRAVRAIDNTQLAHRSQRGPQRLRQFAFLNAL